MYGRPIMFGGGTGVAGAAGGLAYTGAGPVFYIIVLGLLLLAAGMFMLRAGRRRRATD